MAVTKELLQMDLYALLGIEEKATDKEMKKAYRQKALSCHPDKNPDNPRAAELFHQLSQALEVLTDAAARAAYDKVRKAKKQAAERTQKLDERRKKVKLDLEARERQAQAQGGNEEEEEEESRSTGTLEQEIKRLREEGSRQLEEQQRVIQEQIRQEREQRLRGMAENPESKGTPKLKLKWKSKKEAKSQGGYSRDVLLRLFQKYGEVLNLVLSSKKAGTAVVEFATIRAAELAVQNEVGLVDNPLKISWLEGRPQSTMGPNHPGLSQVRSQASRSRAYSGFGAPLPVWALLRALSSQILVIRNMERLAGPPIQAGLRFLADPLSSLSASGAHPVQTS
ncbi:dnaJ homolog subfamily C member 17 isoform X1 [Kogia breviceps]|uniref:dnaJ homolog subfamily C member 17 isoform X1 n=1 Tax=Kogia breviceps TaxID=27615 RepID=UPI002795350E|nr:dnaJ homolog subfamily C member 17 isoform X1 [Kogia breviceps]